MSGRPGRVPRTLGAVVVASVAAWAALAGADGPRAQAPAPAAAPATLRTVSYYPATDAWGHMWTRFDEDRIRADLRAIGAAGFDAVRVFVPPAQFGFPAPARAMTARLERVLAAADAAGLRVGVALFDRFERYADVAGSRRWMGAIAPLLRDDRRVAFVEVRNEVDPYRHAARRWAAAMIASLREGAPGVPIVISTPGRHRAEGLRALARALRHEPPDAYGLHVYGEPSTLAHELARARDAVAPVPLLVGEVGHSTAPRNPAAPGLPPTRWAQEAQQALVVRSAVLATRAAGLGEPGLWTWTDFARDAIPPGVDRRPEELRFGLVRVDGSPKPALADLRALFATGAVAADQNLDFSASGRYRGRLLPTLWRLFQPRAARFSLDAAVGRAAPGSARIDAAGGGHRAVPAFTQRIVGPEIVAGATYAARAWARGVSVTGTAGVALSWFDGDGRFLGTDSSTSLPRGDSGWTPLVVRSQAPAGAVAMEIHLKAGRNRGTVWFDDVEVQT